MPAVPAARLGPILAALLVQQAQLPPAARMGAHDSRRGAQVECVPQQHIPRVLAHARQLARGGARRHAGAGGAAAGGAGLAQMPVCPGINRFLSGDPPFTARGPSGHNGARNHVHRTPCPLPPDVITPQNPAHPPTLQQPTLQRRHAGVAELVAVLKVQAAQVAQPQEGRQAVIGDLPGEQRGTAAAAASRLERIRLQKSKQAGWRRV